jgi:hypothetical protein
MDIHFPSGKNFSRQNRKGFFTNSVKVGLGSTSATWDRVSSILGVPPPVSNFKAIRTVSFRFHLKEAVELRIAKL